MLGTETELLLGTRLSRLREFLDWDWKRPQPRAKDPRHARRRFPPLLVKVIEGLLSSYPDLEVKIVCGQLNQNRDMLVRAAEPASFRIDLMTATDEMPELMAWADLAISGGGSTCWELAFMGLPALAVVLADNQLGVVEELDGRGIVLGLGRFGRLTVDALSSAVRRLLDDRERRAEMSRLGRELIDGRAQVVSCPNSVRDMLTLRLAGEEIPGCLTWANDPRSRGFVSRRLHSLAAQ